MFNYGTIIARFPHLHSLSLPRERGTIILYPYLSLYS